MATAWSKVRGFLRRHKKAEEEIAISAGSIIGWRLLIMAGIIGAGVASAAVLATTSTPTYHPSYTMSPKALAFIERHEGVRYVAYNDPSGIAACTVGAGHVLDWKMCTPTQLRTTISLAQVNAYLTQDTNSARACITGAITYHITQYQFEALVDLVFNAGCGSLGYRDVGGLVNAGELSEVPAALAQTAVTAGGRYLAGLYQRRLDEGVLFAKGYYGDGIGYYVTPKPLTAAQKAEAALRAKTGYYSWLAWYLHEDAWKAYAVHAAIVRPNVPKVIPPKWWKAEKAFVRARAS